MIYREEDRIIVYIARKYICMYSLSCASLIKFSTPVFCTYAYSRLSCIICESITSDTSSQFVQMQFDLLLFFPLQLVPDQ